MGTQLQAASWRGRIAARIFGRGAARHVAARRAGLRSRLEVLGFTLVEILIVVVILGILAALVVPKFASATQDAQDGATIDQLSKVRRALDVYYAKNNQWPDVTAGTGTWGSLTSVGGFVYLRGTPMNSWVGGANGTKIIFGTGPDGSYQTTHGWIYDPVTGSVWAGCFDVNGRPYPRP